MKDLKYLMSYSIALIAFLGISIGGFYNYLAVIYTFIFIPVLEVLVKKCDEKYLKETFNKINFDVSDFIFKFDRSDLNSKRKEDIFAIAVPIEHMEKIFDEESSYVSKIKEKV